MLISLSNCCIICHLSSSVVTICRIIVDKIDKNNDGKVTQPELQQWISHVSKRYVYDDVERTWRYHDTDNDGFINWDEYKDVYSAVAGEGLPTVTVLFLSCSLRIVSLWYICTN